ncbi:MAG: glycosyltransferase family 39 protein [Bacteroidales bacterium]|nr:glycosyltransferase family 39 protein [Bacteroidales bacterium]MCF8404594.1 glycosyltransferase family 39 protein [Bacteroidales bacterium]
MKQALSYFFIVAAGVLFFIPFLGGVHLFDWDEANFAEIAREMIATGNYLQVQINYLPFFEKPPLFFWLQVISMKLFGINEFAARFPNAITGILTLIILYRIGSKLFDKRFGIIWVLAYFGSILPHFYFKSGIIDPVFNLFIFLGIYLLIKFKWKKEVLEIAQNPGWKYLLTGGLLIGLAILTKGPVAWLIVLLMILVYWISVKFRLFIPIGSFVLFSIFAAILMLVWFGLEYFTNGPEFIVEFIVYQIRLFSTEDAGHGGFPGYHLVVMLFGCFPVSIFAIRAFYKMKADKPYQNDFRKWMIILFWVVIILFSIVQSKIVHYSSLAYFPLTFLAAMTIKQIIDKKILFNKWMKFGLISIGFIIASVVFVMPYIGNNINLIKPLFAGNVHALATLDAQVNWTGWEIIPGIILTVGILLFFILKKRDKILMAFSSLFTSVALFVFLGLIFYIARIEAYTQNSYVEYCKLLEGQKAYVVTSGFKSYVQYFYCKPQPGDKIPLDKEHMMKGDVDADVYVFCKKDVEEYWDNHKRFKKLGSKNGYGFYQRIK